MDMLDWWFYGMITSSHLDILPRSSHDANIVREEMMLGPGY